MVVLIILPCAVICIFVYKIIYMVMDEKKKENINNSENDKEK